MDKRQLVLDVMDCKETNEVPVGFWWHFNDMSAMMDGYKNENTVKTLLEGHKKMIEDYKPELIKIMSDGFFTHPSIYENKVNTVEKLGEIKHIDKNHPWITKQIDLIKEIEKMADGKSVILYTIFSPVQQLRLYTEYFSDNPDSFRELMVNHVEEVMKALKVVEEDTLMLLDEIKDNTNIDGIFYSVQMVQDESCDDDYHDKWIVPSDLALLDRMNEHWEYNMLHICGFEHYHNDVKFYKKYPCKSYNRACHTDKTTMKEGLDYFGKCVCGGFDNNAGTLIDTGSLDELKDYTKKLVEDTGKKSFIIGADCTIPGNVGPERIEAIREGANS